MIRKRLMVNKIWNVPELYYKKGAIVTLKYLELSNVLVLLYDTDQDSKIIQKIEKYLANFHTYVEIVKKPTEKRVLELKEKYNNANIDAILAIGGGSVLDLGKVLRYLLCDPLNSLSQLKNDQFLSANRIKLIAIPSTPGTGSETTSVAVLYDHDGRKIPYVNLALLADLIILDPNFMITIPIPLLYEFGADIFSHATEGALSLVSSPLIKSISKSSLDLLKQGFQAIKISPEDIKGLANIQYAGYLAGLVQGNAFVGVAHALAHSLEIQKTIGHGKAMLHLIYPVLSWINSNKPNNLIEEFLAIYTEIGFLNYVEPNIFDSIDEEKWMRDALDDPSITTSPIRMNEEKMKELFQWILKQP